MPASSFAQLIISKLAAAIGNDGSGFSASTPMSANQAVADAITEYIKSNTQIMSSYTGMIPSVPSPVPDPIVADVHTVDGMCAPITPPPPSGEPSKALLLWLTSLETNIKTGFFLMPGTAGVTFASPVFPFATGMLLNGLSQATVDGLKNEMQGAIKGNESSPQQAVWEVLAQKILDMIVACPVGGGPAINSSSGSTGVGAITSNVIV